MNNKVFLLVALIIAGQNLQGQKLFAAIYENSANVIQNITDTHFLINRDKSTLDLQRDQTNVFLKDIPMFLPGYLKIEDEGMVDMETDDQNRKVGNTFYFRYNAKITSNRDIDSPYIVLQWMRDEKTVYIEAKALDNLSAGKRQHVSLNVYVPDRYRLVKPTIHYMCMGFEIGTSRTIVLPVTPYEFAVNNAGEDGLKDGNLKPLQMFPTKPITDSEGNKRVGSAHLLMHIDKNGYVKGIEVNKCTEWIFAKTALMDAPFFLFQPRIVDGEPVETRIVLPFRFGS